MPDRVIFRYAGQPAPSPYEIWRRDNPAGTLEGFYLYLAGLIGAPTTAEMDAALAERDATIAALQGQVTSLISELNNADILTL